MNLYCNDLSFDFPIFLEHFDWRSYGITDDPDKTQNIHKKLEDGLFNPKFIELLSEYQCYIHWQEVFYRRITPDNTSGIHIDMAQEGDYIKLNFAYGSPDSYMQWWNKKPEIEKLVSDGTANPWGSPTKHYEPWEVDFVHRQKVGTPSIVQVGVPHNLYIPTTERCCVSLVLRDSNTKARLTMQDACERFVKYLV